MNRNVSKPLRAAYINALGGRIVIDDEVVPVYDSWNTAIEASTNHIIIDSITDTTNETLDTYISEAIVTLQAVTIQQNSFSSDMVEDMEDQIMMIIKPTINSTLLELQNFNICSVKKENSRALNEVDENGYIGRRIITISQLLTVK